MPAHTITGPDWAGEYGTAEQCAAFVGIDQRLWLELDMAGLILPPAARRSREIARWHWHSAVSVSLCLVHLTGKLRAWLKERKNNRKKPARTGRSGTENEVH